MSKSKGCAERRDPEKCRADARERARKHRVRNPGYYTNKEWTSRNSDAYLRKNLKHNYGLTLEEYQDMVEAQEGRCAICGTDNPTPHDRLYVDHDHVTGKVRGLLCQKCNLALGLFKDSRDVLGSAILYLERH